jgi:exopolysaccharide biosynthesis polyprenyl glycosylphosphotransferase
MRPAWHRSWRLSALLIDACAVLIAAGTAAVLRFGPLGALEVTRPDSYGPWLLAPPIWLATMAAFGLYSPTKCASAVEEARRIAGAGFAAPVVYVVFTFLIKSNPSRLWVGLSTALALLSVGSGRRLLRFLGARLRLRGRWLTPAVVVGRREAKRLMDMFIEDRGSGYEPVATCGFSWNGLPAGGLEEIERKVTETGAGAVLIVSEDLERDEISRAVAISDSKPASVVIIPGLDYMLAHNLQIVGVGRQPGLALEAPSLRPYQRVLKRSMDLAFSSVMLVGTLPILALVAALVKLDSPGSVLFRQRRIGLYRSEFSLLKFRTMVAGAHERLDEVVDRNEADGLLFKLRDDPRLTRVGKILRRWSLDELPQLWNVLRGDMSLVGPRPALPDEVEIYESAIERRLNARPGITGLWQINGRSALPFEDYVRLDLTYVQNWSPLLDVYVLLRTIPAVLRGTGAY